MMVYLAPVRDYGEGSLSFIFIRIRDTSVIVSRASAKEG